MARSFSIPTAYRSSLVGAIKSNRLMQDAKKKDLAPTVLSLGPVTFKIARHFGFCFGVQNAIEIAYRALEENPDKRVFLLSEMIHNPHVNGDLIARGVRFLQTPSGEQLIPFEEIHSDDIVIVPAFGTTVELFATLEARGVNPRRYDATCPFVEKVWKRAEQLGAKGYTVIIHGKHTHEETRATFSHARIAAPSLVILNMAEAVELAKFITGEKPPTEFFSVFAGRASPDFAPERDLLRIGVVNQTTMLATETQAIAEYLKEAVKKRINDHALSEYFADTRDTLCYATNENQDATYALIASGGDSAIVVGGYNSSNTSHLAELLEQHVPTYYIKDSDEILSQEAIQHLSLKEHCVVTTNAWLPTQSDPTILITAGASCPDAQVDQVLTRVASLYGVEDALVEAVSQAKISS
jgi:4-hydroxy-3-methylbut-2-enyl diphosphate reductase